MIQDDYSALFIEALGASGARPFEYQQRLAHEPWPDVLDVPTGLGKTAAVVLAWLWKRGWRVAGGRVAPDLATPRRLVYCLPMRVLVEQTSEVCGRWLERLGIAGRPGEGRVSLHELMGGSEDLREAPWAEHPEEDMILVGTQDMLLSRALMRGYGMSRYQWPVHFALLHNDCLWAFDEVQLMGAGLATSTQLDAFRRTFALGRTSRSLWMSATLNRDWLATVDMRPRLARLTTLAIGSGDRNHAAARLAANKTLAKAAIALDQDCGGKSGLDRYVEALSSLVLERHDVGAQTLVIVNRVDRAQQLFRRLRAHRGDRPDLLIHARFRAAERTAQARALREGATLDRIVVATQAIEAGVDVSSKVLITELAPWAAMAQRFGRCNRYGEYNDSGAEVQWIDIEEGADARPYDPDALASARRKLHGLPSRASPGDLPATDEPSPLTAVLRRKDLLDLFNTDPDLSGFDVDVSDYIRDTASPGVQVFWRSFGESPNQPEPQAPPTRDELCPASVGQARTFAMRKGIGVWHWDALDRQWFTLPRDREPRPGMILLARAEDGGYDNTIGFDPGLTKPAVSVLARATSPALEDYSEDWRSHQRKPVALVDHLGHVARHAEQICAALGEVAHREAVVRAGRWHDVGKAHPVFQDTMHKCEFAPPEPLAKSRCKGRHERRFFRHELASMLAWLAQHDGDATRDLVAYLIVAHHGKVRTSLRAMPTEEAPPGVRRHARGIWEGDVLPALEFDGEHSAETRVQLALMEIGLGEQGPSWTERTLGLLHEHGPFRLAWLETLVRLADWRASRAEQLASTDEGINNGSHGLDHSHPPMAPAQPRAAAPGTPSPAGGQSGPQHGFRRGAGGPAQAGSRTGPPHAATRYLDTCLGVLSYAELAPHLAQRIGVLQNAVDDGAFDARELTEHLLLDFHRAICGDLTPAFAGRWRSTDVRVGDHEPPPAHQVASLMREFVRDLAARLEHLPQPPDALWLEALAFAEGRLLSIHPFADFNGRVARVFSGWLARRLALPEIELTPEAGEATDRYLAALRAADRRKWQPLMEIWRERIEQGAR